MECNEARPLISAYVDQELSAPETLALERHLAGCPGCREVYVAQRTLRDDIRRQAPFHAAPASLRANILAHLPDAEAARPARCAAGKFAWPRWGGWRFVHFVPAVVGLCALAWSLGLYLNTPSADDMLEKEVVSSHVRALISNHATDVLSSDQHTVKPWFNGKLDFAPPVVDLSAQGFPLAGGRVDYLDGRAVAALVYHRNKHPIALYIWPQAEGSHGSPPVALAQQGYHLIHWSDAQMVYWAITDAAAPDLQAFCRDFRAALSLPPPAE